MHVGPSTGIWSGVEGLCLAARIRDSPHIQSSVIRWLFELGLVIDSTSVEFGVVLTAHRDVSCIWIFLPLLYSLVPFCPTFCDGLAFACLSDFKGGAVQLHALVDEHPVHAVSARETWFEKDRQFGRHFAGLFAANTRTRSDQPRRSPTPASAYGRLQKCCAILGSWVRLPCFVISDGRSTINV
jgi:hypothetical protein